MQQHNVQQISVAIFTIKIQK